VLGQFSFSGNGSTGWLACPVAEEGPWQVFAAVEWLDDGDVLGACVNECIRFEALTAEYNRMEPAAFQLSEAVRMAGRLEVQRVATVSFR